MQRNTKSIGNDVEQLTPVELMHATVQLEQPLGNGTRTVGTGFLISEIAPDGSPRTVLVTANHVFQDMPGQVARIGYRVENADGSWSYTPQPLRIRSAMLTSFRRSCRNPARRPSL